MNNFRQVILDVEGDNSTPPGYLVINDPVDLVGQSLTTVFLHVKGKFLCNWAAVLGEGRGWHITWQKSPATELCDKCPELSIDEAKELVVELGEKLCSLTRPLQVPEVLATLCGNERLWMREPGILHAFDWLCWLAQQNNTGTKWKLIYVLTQVWQIQAPQQIKIAYSAKSAEEAWSLLLEWLKVFEPTHMWPAAPQAILKGNLEKRLKEELIKQAVNSRTDYFNSLLERSPDKELLKAAAQACTDVLLKNPIEITQERLKYIVKYLPYDTVLQLKDLLNPGDPGFPEWHFDQLVTWFREKYLPYREWTYRHGITDKLGIMLYNANEFARQYLDYYVSARVGGEGAEHFAWVKSAGLRFNKQGNVFLLIVLDGLAFPDAQRLCEQIEKETHELYLVNQSIALSPLPTVTEFAKPAVSKGLLPSEAFGSTPSTYSSVDEVSSGLTAAKPGELLVWTLQEPDRTYHFRADAGPRAVRLEADAQLSTLAKFVASIINNAPKTLRLRIVITTDHGRLLINSRRTLQVPSGMKAHGRAAWGTCEVQFNKNGYTVDNDLIYLDPSRFGLPQGLAYVVIASDQAFVTSDGRKGNEPFPHGGLSPEEVLVPWFEFTRILSPILIEVELVGKGEEGKPGIAKLTIANLSDIPFKLTSVTNNKQMISRIENEIGALQKCDINVTLPKWPGKQELEGLVLTLNYILSNGQPLKSDFKPKLETESIYEKPNILIDFKGL